MNARTLKIDLKDPDESAQKQIEFLKQSLIDCRGKSDRPEELEWEIRLYDFMLEDPRERLRSYLRARDVDGTGRKVPKREVVRVLGWVVP